MLDIAVDKDPAHDGAAAEFLSDLVHRAVGRPHFFRAILGEETHISFTLAG